MKYRFKFTTPDGTCPATVFTADYSLYLNVYIVMWVDDMEELQYTNYTVEEVFKSLKDKAWEVK